MKKYFLAVTFFLFSAFIFLSCKKDSTKTPTTSGSGAATGYWFGNFANAYNLGEVFKSDGTSVQYDFYGTSTTDTASCPYKGYGTYTINGNNVSLSVTFPTVANQIFNLKGVLNTSTNPNTISGTYSSPNGGGSGNFTFTKQ